MSITIFDKTLLIMDNKSSLYYIFDLVIGKITYPNVETNINTFIFTQIVGIILSVLFTQM